MAEPDQNKDQEYVTFLGALAMLYHEGLSG